VSALAFELPRPLEATAPPEERGLRRDQVRLLVASGADRPDRAITHARFDELPTFLRAGDLLVINTSATLPAAIGATRNDGTPVRVHVSTRVPGLEHDARWRVIELRSADGGAPARGRAGETLTLAGDGGGALELVAPYLSSRRLIVALHHGDTPLDGHMRAHGEPIRYGYSERRWPLSAYQTVYATTPGSAEMASAGRPFTAELLTRLIAAGVQLAPITLHCGVSSLERHEPPFPETFVVPDTTARIVNNTRRAGGRVIAVGTTVVRALETAADEHGIVVAADGWTHLVITPDADTRAIDGLITGWHEPEASHLQMLEAVAGPELLARSYEQALSAGYLWHEFGDSHLLLR
jgi:S-adenosylmethionine:tRNA ribosyltransferase-isomerase